MTTHGTTAAVLLGVLLSAACEGAPPSPEAASWSEMATGKDGLLGIWGAAPNDVFAVGAAGAIVHYDGRTWTPMAVEGGPWFMAA